MTGLRLAARESIDPLDRERAARSVRLITREIRGARHAGVVARGVFSRAGLRDRSPHYFFRTGPNVISAKLVRTAGDSCTADNPTTSRRFYCNGNNNLAPNGPGKVENGRASRLKTGRLQAGIVRPKVVEIPPPPEATNSWENFGLLRTHAEPAVAN